MLEIVWFFVLTVAGLALCLKANALMEQEDRRASHRGGALWWLAILAFVFALLVSADATVKPLYAWLLAALPQPGTEINRFAARAVTGIACTLYAVGIPLFLPSSRPGISKARHPAGDAGDA